ncbi:MAG: NAD(+)/NADH kinase [Lachnospiraceae bacterium]|nr:NAD(+)/NADH kinase [Lachnospiraceae bacterium]
MKNYLIVTKNERELQNPFTTELKKYIEDKGGVAEVVARPRDDSNLGITVPEGVEGIFTIGGDGTLVRAAQMTFESNVPLMGVNHGHLGYLCDLNEDSVYPAIDRMFANDYEIEERMMLSGYVIRSNGEKTPIQHSLNDIVVSSDDGKSVIRLTVYINGEYLYSIQGDGMIFATPTGSTAYNLSANGPIVDPKTEAILMTPINPHTLNSRSIVLDSEDEISIEITPRRQTAVEAATVLFDGSFPYNMVPGDRLVVRKSNRKTKMIFMSKMNFLQRMRNKMQEN